MRVTILTYDCPHRKTQDVLSNMLASGRFELSLALVPFTPRPERAVAFKHRPFQFEGPSAQELANRHRLAVADFRDWRNIKTDYFVVCGANLLESDFVLNNKVVNCHAGLIPLTRGLDSFKWSILKGNPVGNTLHLIDDGVDMGVILHHEITDEYESDDLSTFADRHYRNELRLLSDFDRYLTSGRKLDLNIGEPTMRMPVEVEQDMIRSFDDHKAIYARQTAAAALN